MGDPQNYELCIDTGTTSFEEAVDVIWAMYREL